VRSGAAGTERTLLGRAVILTLLAGVVSGVVAAVTVGREGTLAALVALGLVLGFLVLGQLPVAQAARGRRGTGAALLLLLYSVRIAVLLGTFRIFYTSDGLDRDVLGLTVIACAAGWTVGTVWSALRWRPMVVEPDEPAGTGPG
jgi:hypothetical protein